jgi:aspartate aminotransferase
VLAAAASYFERRRMPTDPDQLIVAPGSKALLMAVIAAVPGDVLLPRPCWVTYPSQARFLRRRYHTIPVPAGYGGVPDPVSLRRAIGWARAEGGNPGLLVLTVPDNPTGTLAPPEAVRAVCAVAEQEHLVIVSDEIYRDLVFDPTTPMLSPAEVAPDRTVVTTGLSKSLALGGWRIGVARFPDSERGHEVRHRVLAIASEVWSTLAGPMQQVAEYAFSEPPELRAHVVRSAELHGAVAGRVHQILSAVGASCRPPSAGFYVYPDFEGRRKALATRGVVDSASLESHLLERYGIAVLGGQHFADCPRALRFRAATSQLYGDTEDQRRATFRAKDPLREPQVARVLTRLADAFADLMA